MHRSKTVAETFEMHALELMPKREQIPQTVKIKHKCCDSKELLDAVRLRVKQAL